MSRKKSAPALGALTALGAVVGGASASHKQEEVYKRVYDECMRTG